MVYKNIAKKIRKIFTKRALVLMYHRIASPKTDPWRLSVNPTHFEEQLQVLNRHFKVLPLSEMVEALINGNLKSNTVCLTFDDGYNDNYQIARPILEKYNCPATFFIASHYAGRQEEFWWDALGTIFLETKELPSSLEINIYHEQLKFSLANDANFVDEFERIKTWHWPEEPPTNRALIYMTLWEKLRPLPFDQINTIMQTLHNWAGNAYHPIPANYPMTADELERLFRHTLVDIGIHTHTHPALAYHDKAVQKEEINTSRLLLQKGNEQVNLLAYPYGNYNQDTIDVANELGLKSAFTTGQTVVDSGTDRFQIGRFQVNDWNGEIFLSQLKSWLS